MTSAQREHIQSAVTAITDASLDNALALASFQKVLADNQIKIDLALQKISTILEFQPEAGEKPASKQGEWNCEHE